VTDASAGESIVVPAALEGERIDRALAFVTGWPRASVQTLLEVGNVLVDGRRVAKSARLHEGNVVEILAEPEPDAPPVPDPTVPVEVVFADEAVIVVAKPAGLVVHPGAGNADGTLAHGLLARYPEIAGVGEPFRPGIVHRLDRDTSGLLVVARTTRAYEELVRAIASRAVDRRYTALVWGRLPAPRGAIDAPIGRSQHRRTRMAVRGEGKEARTEYDVQRVFDAPVCSLVACRLETGRTHQIRVHLAAVGNPIVGDGTYGGARDQLPLDRPFLHADSLAFAHPYSGEPLQFEAPLPPDLTAMLARLDRPDRPDHPDDDDTTS
jgi:23S rRNA pseudouridine1911/1915/1917 synthase